MRNVGSDLAVRYAFIFLIAYGKYNWKLRIVDQNKQTVEDKINGHENASALNFDATKSALRKSCQSEKSFVPPRPTT